MYGAIVGDIAGSPYEFTGISAPVDDRDLFPPNADYTDDTLLTLAVYRGVIDADGNEALGAQAIAQALKSFSHDFKLGRGGYGETFTKWALSPGLQPLSSFGNGSAMRVSSIGWLFPTIEQTERWAGISAAVTHNHPEGIKGAQSTAAAIFMARTGHTKEMIKRYTQLHFGYNTELSWKIAALGNNGGLSCQTTVPEAIEAFLQADSFEHCLRLAISLGGDTDTRAAIAGSIAEPFFGIPNELDSVGQYRGAVRSRLPRALTELLDDFEMRTVAQRLAAVIHRMRKSCAC